MEASAFYDIIMPSAGLRCMALPGKKPGMFFHFWGDDNAWLAKATQYADVKRSIDTYFACATYASRESRKQSNVAYVRSFWADVDCGEGKPYAHARDGAAAVLGFAAHLGLPRPYIVASGTGIHVYWPMAEDMVPAVWKTTAQLLKAALKQEGVNADPTRTADEASILRPPGTHHRKRDPKLVRVAVEGEIGTLTSFQETLLPYAQFVPLGAANPKDGFLPEGGPAAGLNVDGNAALGGGIEYRDSSPDLIADKCGVLRHMRDTLGLMSQPEWYNCLGVLAFAKDGDARAHEWSKGDPRYSPAETQTKLDQQRKVRPTTCAKFSDNSPAICGACPHNVKTPYTLGLSDRATVEVIETVRTAKGFTTKAILHEMPWGYQAKEMLGGKHVMQVKIVTKNDEGEEIEGWDTFCETRVVPTARLWIEGVAFVECEMDLRGLEKRRFLLEGGIIGKGKDSLAAELARNEVVVPTGKGHIMDTYLKRWMQQLKETAPLVVAHRHFGWEEESFILGDTVLSPGGISNRAVLVGIAKSKGPALIPKGNLDVWTHVIDRAYNAPGQEAYQFLVGCAFAAPLLSLFGEVNGVTVFAHSEGSGAGKTTAQRAGLSAWGDWEDLMLADKKTTPNALWGLIGAYSNIPVVFDELTNMPNDVASDLVFSVSSGRGKERMNAAGEIRESNGNWRTILLASGNNLLSEKVSMHRANAEAEVSRLFEFTLDASPHLTPNEANALFPQLRKHYGHAGYIFAQYLVDNRDTVRAMLERTQAKLNTELGITQVERYWSALLASVLVSVALCRNLGLLQFDLRSLKVWMVKRLQENRGIRLTVATDPLGLFGQMMSDLWPGVLVTNGEGDVRRNGAAATVIQAPKGQMTGRAIVPVDKNDAPVLLLNQQSVRDWANKKGVSAREMFNAVVHSKWADAEIIRYSLGRGTVEYSQTSSYLGCWRLYPERIGGATGAAVVQKLGVVHGGRGSSGSAQQ